MFLSGISVIRAKPLPPILQPARARRAGIALFAAAVLYPGPLTAASPSLNSLQTAAEARSGSIELRTDFPPDAPAAAAEWAKNVVKAVTYKRLSGRIVSEGSGFLVKGPRGQPLLFTAYHVLKDNNDSMKTAFFDSSGSQLTAKKTVFYLKKLDALVLELEGAPLESGFSLADGSVDGPADSADGPVYILGYPMIDHPPKRGLFIPDKMPQLFPEAAHKTMSLTEGVSFYRRGEPRFAIVNKNDYRKYLDGASGGPVLNGKGEVLGIIQGAFPPPSFFYTALRADLQMDELSGKEAEEKGIRESLARIFFIKSKYRMMRKHFLGTTCPAFKNWLTRMPPWTRSL